MAFNGRVRAVFVRAHERVMSAPRSAVLAVASLASVLVVVACAYGVLSSRHAVTVADSAAGGEGRVVASWGRTVGDLLTDGGVPVGECDQVTPGVETSLAGVDSVSVVRCRSALVHDGVGGVVSVGTVGRFARLLAQADQVCVEARAYKGVLWRDGAVGRALVESVRVPLPLLVAHYRGQAARDLAALASGRGDVGRRVKLARNVARQELCADSLAEYGVFPVVSWQRVLDGVSALSDAGVVDADVLAGVGRMAGVSR